MGWFIFRRRLQILVINQGSHHNDPAGMSGHAVTVTEQNWAHTNTLLFTPVLTKVHRETYDFDVVNFLLQKMESTSVN